MAHPLEIFIRDWYEYNIKEKQAAYEQQGEVDRALSDTFDIHHNTICTIRLIAISHAHVYITLINCFNSIITIMIVYII